MAANPLGAVRTFCVYMLMWLSVSIGPAPCISVDIANDIGEARLVKALTSVDRVMVRPTMDYTKPTHVTFQFSLVYIKELNMAKQEFTFTGLFVVQWNDPYLAWNITDYDNILFTWIPASSIWTPKFVILNSFNGRRDDTEWRKADVTVLYDGNVTWYPSGVYNTACDVNVFSFPFDTQKCNLSVFQWQTTETESIYNGINFDSSTDTIENMEWKIINREVINQKTPYGATNISNIVFRYTFVRQSSYYIITIIVPIVLLFIVGLMVFPLPTDSGEKVSLCVACLMSFFLTQLTISEQMPRSWKSVPVIMVFNSLFMLLNMLSVCVTVLVLNLHHKQTVNDVPKWLERIFEYRWRSMTEIKNKVGSCDLKVLDILDTEVEKIHYIPEKGEQSIASLLSSILEVVQKVADDHSNQVNEGEVIKRKWRDVADAVNAILCGVYIFTALAMGVVCIGMWTHGQSP